MRRHTLYPDETQDATNNVTTEYNWRAELLDSDAQGRERWFVRLEGASGTENYAKEVEVKLGLSGSRITPAE